MWIVALQANFSRDVVSGTFHSKDGGTTTDFRQAKAFDSREDAIASGLRGREIRISDNGIFLEK